jgi:hypothetical protein
VESELVFGVKACLVSVLLESACVGRPNCAVLVVGFVDYLVVVAKFGEQFLGVGRGIATLLLLQKVGRFIASRNSEEEI